MYDKALRAFNAKDFTDALKELDALDARQPDLAESQNLRGVIFMRQAMFDKANAALQESIRINPKFWNARFNLAEIPFLKRDWAEARNRFQDLLSSNPTELQGKQLIRFKIFLTYLVEGKEAMADSILADMRIPDGTPASYYADAAIALHNKDTEKANFCIAAAETNFSSQLNKVFAASLYEVGLLRVESGKSASAITDFDAKNR